MEHSIGARLATRPRARFVQSSPRARERRLGLSTVGFHPASGHLTILRQPEPSPLEQLRAGSRSHRVAGVPSSLSGGPRPAFSVRWIRAARTGPVRRPSAAPAPWRG